MLKYMYKILLIRMFNIRSIEYYIFHCYQNYVLANIFTFTRVLLGWFYNADYKYIKILLHNLCQSDLVNVS